MKRECDMYNLFGVIIVIAGSVERSMTIALCDTFLLRRGTRMSQKSMEV